jgi:hypothetical protein
MAARSARLKVQNYIYDLFSSTECPGGGGTPPDLREAVFSALAADLHTPKALAEVFVFIKTTGL